MKLYLTKEEVEEIEDTGLINDIYDFIRADENLFNWILRKQIYKANKLGFPFSIALKESYVIEAMYNGGVLIRPYDKAVDFAINNIE